MKEISLSCPTCSGNTLDPIGAERNQNRDGQIVYVDSYYYCSACGHCAVTSTPPGRPSMLRPAALSPYQIVRVLKLRRLALPESGLVNIQPQWEDVEQEGIPSPPPAKKTRLR